MNWISDLIQYDVVKILSVQSRYDRGDINIFWMLYAGGIRLAVMCNLYNIFKNGPGPSDL